MVYIKCDSCNGKGHIGGRMCSSCNGLGKVDAIPKPIIAKPKKHK